MKNVAFLASGFDKTAERQTMPFSLTEVNAMSAQQFMEAFADIAEHSPWVAETAAAARPFADREQLIQAFETAALSAPRERQLQLLRAHPELRGFMVANALWEFSFMGLKSFVVLYIVKCLGESVALASAVMGIVAASYVLAAAVSGHLADRVGLVRLLRWAIWVYGAGLLFAATVSSTGPLLVGLPFVALAGAVLMTLPYGLLMRLTPAGAEGAVSGLFNLSRAVGVILGPIVVGAAIDLGEPLFRSTHGYGAMWATIGVPIVLSLAFLASFERQAAPATTQASLDELALSA
jgi:MFS family permease